MTKNSLNKAHHRQFVLGTSSFIANSNWQSKRLDNNYWLSYCSDLQLSSVEDCNNRHWYLLGLAIETTTNIAPENQIAHLSTIEVINSYSSWAGRWLLIGNGQIHLDANGLLGCFYGVDAKEKVWVSSSPVLLSQILETNVKDERTLSYGQGISWYTPPYSGFKQIKRLLASQILNFTSGEIIYRPLMPEIQINRDYEQTLTEIQNALITPLQNLGKQQQPLWLGMTAGFDSRLMLAISKTAAIKFTTFTRIAERMSLADRLLPPKLARICQIPHLFLRHKPPKEQSTRKQLVRQHSANNVSDGDAEPFIMGVRDSLAGITFGGHGFAIASGFHTLRQLPATFTSPREGAMQIARLFNEPVDSSAVEGMTAWLTWVQEHPQEHLNWRDRFFLEQRQAGWLSSKEQVYDLTDLTRFPILNAARTYSLLLSIPPTKRLGSLVQIALLERIAPELLKYPFNPADNYFNRWVRIVTKTRDNPKYLYWQIKDKLF